MKCVLSQNTFYGLALPVTSVGVYIALYRWRGRGEEAEWATIALRVGWEIEWER